MPITYVFSQVLPNFIHQATKKAGVLIIIRQTRKTHNMVIHMFILSELTVVGLSAQSSSQSYWPTGRSWVLLEYPGYLFR